MKKNKYIIGDFETDDLNDYGIAKFYYQRYEEVIKRDFEKTKKLTDLETEQIHLKNAVYKYVNLLRKVVEFLQTNCLASNEWKEVSPSRFKPIGKVRYKSLSGKKVQELLEMLGFGHEN